MAKPLLSLIAAVAENGVIGRHNAMPWRLSTDQKRFRQLTMGKPVVMGRRTFESIGKPLPGRKNIVVSRQSGFAPDGVTVAASLDDALGEARRDAEATGRDEIVVMGGGEIYAAAIDDADRLYITRVETAPPGDSYFPDIDPDVWEAKSTERVPAGEKDSAPTIFTIYERRRRLHDPS